MIIDQPICIFTVQKSSPESFVQELAVWLMSRIPYNDKKFISSSKHHDYVHHEENNAENHTLLLGISGKVLSVKNRVQIFLATITEFIDFLTYTFHDNKKEYSTIYSYCSAMSNTHPQINGYPIGKHPRLIRIFA